MNFQVDWEWLFSRTQVLREILLIPGYLPGYLSDLITMKETIDCFIEQEKIDFFYSCWKYLILFIVLNKYFHEWNYKSNNRFVISLMKIFTLKQ